MYIFLCEVARRIKWMSKWRYLEGNPEVGGLAEEMEEVDRDRDHVQDQGRIPEGDDSPSAIGHPGEEITICVNPSTTHGKRKRTHFVLRFTQPLMFGVLDKLAAQMENLALRQVKHYTARRTPLL
jgi:MFS superfamily sulfate permease-like transporter